MTFVLLLLGLGLLELHELDVLLGDARATLGDAAGLLVAQERTERALDVERPVLVEPRVLDGQDRPLHHGGDLLEGHLDAVLVVEGRDGRAVGRQQPAPLRQWWLLEIAVHAVEGVGGGLGGEPKDARERDHEPGDEGAGQGADDHEHQEMGDEPPLSRPSGHPADPAHSALAYAVGEADVCRTMADLLSVLSPGS